MRATSSAVTLALMLGCAGSGSGPERPDTRSRAAGSFPAATYWIYVGAESADLIHRVRFGPDGAVVERSTPVGHMPVDTDGPHGLQISRDGRYLYMTTGHGLPDGKFWKIALGPDTVAGGPLDLGRFPATLDLTPDGLYAFVVNFNLYGAHVPSSVSVVYTENMFEVARIETCTMPHGSRVNAQGSHQYSACMMDDEVVEIDTRTFEVSRRFSVAPGAEGPVADVAATSDHGTDRAHTREAGCSPTWAQPSAGGDRIFVACNRSDQILEIDAASWRVTRRFRTGRGPYNLDVTSDGGLLVATLKQGNAVEFIDLERGESGAVAETSTTVVHGVTLSPDDRYAFVSVEGVGAEPGKVDVFDLRSFVRVASVEVGQQASGITFWRMEPATAQ